MNSKRGFTLVELMVVVAIIGVLGTALLPQVTGLVEKAKASKIISLVDTLRTACAGYYSDVGAYPYEYAAPTYTGAGNHRLSIAQPTISAWAGPYLHTILSWGDNPYVNLILVYSNINNWYTALGTAGFDLDNDGTTDTASNAGNFVVFYSIPLTVAQRVNNLIDGDTTTNANWMTQGQVEYRNSAYLSVYLQGGR